MPRPALRLLLLVGFAVLARPGAAQTTVWTDAPLADVLYDFASQSGLDLVFAVRVVRDKRVSARYSAREDPDGVLRRLLAGTGIRAEPLRPGQYVLIAVPLNVTLGGDGGAEAYSGTLDGRVVDAETGESLPGASVWLVDVGLGAVADLDGAFAIVDLPAGRYQARVTYVGYRAVRVALDVYPLSPRLPPVVRLQPEPVSSFVAEVKAGAADAGPVPGVTDVAARGVAALSSPLGRGDLAAALAALPGLTRTGGFSGRLVVRGADPDALRVLRDGVPVYEPWHAGGLVSTLQPEALGRILLHRGQFPAAIGGGLAAVLETESTSALVGDTTSTVALSPVAVRGAADVALGRRAGLHVGGLRSVLGGWLAAGVRADSGVAVVDPLGGRRGDGRRPDVAFESGEASLAVRLGPTSRLDVSGWAARDRLRMAGVGPQRGDTASASGRTWAASARVRSLVGQRTFVTALAYRTRVDDASGAAGSDAEALVETAVGLDIDRALSLRHTVSVGVRAADRLVEGRFARGDGGADRDRQRAAEAVVYVADTWSPALAWQVQGGIRAEATQGASGPRVLVAPRLFARWAADRLVLRAGVSRQTQPVQRLVGQAAGREGPLALAAARWAVAGATAPPASAWQAGAGAEWAPSAALALSAEVYGRLDRDVLRSVPQPGVERDRFSGFAATRGRAGGLEVAARLAARSWTVTLAGAAAVAEARTEGGAWSPAPFARPLAVGVLAERAVGPLALGLRLDAASGLVSGTSRAPADVRAGIAVGVVAKPRGVRVDVLAQMQARLAGASGGTDDGAALPLALAVESRALPAVPTVSVSVRW